jgi:hypothetical protein
MVWLVANLRISEQFLPSTGSVARFTNCRYAAKSFYILAMMSMGV